MIRWSVLAAGAVAMVCAAFVAGASVPARTVESTEVKADAAKSVLVIGQKTAVFNMAAVMRDFHQAKYQVWLLNNKKTEMSKKLLAWRDEYLRHQQGLQKNPNHPDKEKIAQKMLALARQIEDEDRRINKQLNEEASVIISDLYDMMKAAVDRIAQSNGFQLVLAYPDAVTHEEQQSPYIKELKLKPPAAQPFYAAPEIDITARLVDALNEKHPPIDAETMQLVDVSTLEAPPAAAPFPGGLVPPPNPLKTP
ncbi:OmpH family outer membrane protein [Frigoriglobus tundricola]|uniref:Outer membrane protein H n=1 Tax=Frigoriglobus tundricola TaxID=2774151 RepID=A0A6M5YPQ4_9BACT|nr:OmpH family outer membrane protein [Frigoriglobus tundricola]QJW96027.1 hypothetical protein FTUN_3581 [Frigoriglobus tundricola]